MPDSSTRAALKVSVIIPTFNRAGYRVMGITPTEYREKNRG